MAACVVRAVSLLALTLSVTAQTGFAQESWSVGGLAGCGVPPAIGGLRVSTRAGPKVGIDLDVAWVGPDSGMGVLLVTDVRWMRRGRAASGNGRYWIFGAAVTRHTNSTTVVYPGRHVVELVERHEVVIPRIGYGWDHVSRTGIRVGLDLTSGSVGEEAGMLLAVVFVTWGPPRR